MLGVEWVVVGKKGARGCWADDGDTYNHRIGVLNFVINVFVGLSISSPFASAPNPIIPASLTSLLLHTCILLKRKGCQEAVEEAVEEVEEVWVEEEGCLGRPHFHPWVSLSPIFKACLEKQLLYTQ